MSELPQPKDSEKMASLKTLTGVVYLCQVLAFGFGGLTLLIGIAINFMKRDEVKGTWLESHFDWQINTVWITLAGFALAAVLMVVGIGYFILLPVVLLLIYRIVIGWMAWTAEKPVKHISG
jgi:Predicted membrane protein